MTHMEKLLHAGNRYLKEMDLEDMAALKLCLISLGTLMGIGVSQKMKKPVGLMAGLLFLGTYVPLMSRFTDLYSKAEYAAEDVDVVYIHEEE